MATNKAQYKKKAPAEQYTAKIGTYIGRRMTVKDQIAHYWEFDSDSDKASGFLKQLVPAQIGERFVFQFTASDSVVTRGEHGPKEAPASGTPSREQVDEWIVKDEAAMQMKAEDKARREMKNRESEFELALKPLRRILDASRSHSDRAALITRITSELWRR